MPLAGPASWDLIAAELAGRGYEVSVPDLTGTVAAGPPYCSRQAEVIARGASGQPTILIGHSGAGPLLAAAASSGVRGLRLRRCRPAGWLVTQRASHHLALVTDPGAVAGSLCDLLDRLPARR